MKLYLLHFFMYTEQVAASVVKNTVRDIYIQFVVFLKTEKAAILETGYHITWCHIQEQSNFLLIHVVSAVVVVGM